MRLNGVLTLSKVSRPIGVGSNFGGRRISVQEITVDSTSTDNSPQPNNDEIHNLIVLQMEVAILTAEMHHLARLNNALGGGFGTSMSTAVNDDISVTNPDGVKIDIKGNRFQTRSKLLSDLLQDRRTELKDAITDFRMRLSGSFSKMIF